MSVKGSRSRVDDIPRYESNWDAIFGCKDKTEVKTDKLAAKCVEVDCEQECAEECINDNTTDS